MFGRSVRTCYRKPHQIRSSSFRDIGKYVAKKTAKSRNLLHHENYSIDFNFILLSILPESLRICYRKPHQNRSSSFRDIAKYVSKKPRKSRNLLYLENLLNQFKFYAAQYTSRVPPNMFPKTASK